MFDLHLPTTQVALIAGIFGLAVALTNLLSAWFVKLLEISSKQSDWLRDKRFDEVSAALQVSSKLKILLSVDMPGEIDEYLNVMSKKNAVLVKANLDLLLNVVDQTEALVMLAEQNSSNFIEVMGKFRNYPDVFERFRAMRFSVTILSDGQIIRDAIDRIHDECRRIHNESYLYCQLGVSALGVVSRQSLGKNMPDYIQDLQDHKEKTEKQTEVLKQKTDVLLSDIENLEAVYFSEIRFDKKSVISQRFFDILASISIIALAIIFLIKTKESYFSQEDIQAALFRLLTLFMIGLWTFKYAR